MKKVFLCVAIACCLAICGTAFAVTYYDSGKVNGTVTADQCIILDLDQSSSVTKIELSEAQPVIYKIACGVNKSATATVNATLNINLAATAGNNLTGVTVTLYSDALCNNAVESKTQTGTGDITITGISSSTDYYAKITFVEPDTQAELAKVNGVMTVSFTQA